MTLGRDELDLRRACVGPELLGPFGTESDLVEPLKVVDKVYTPVSTAVKWPIQFARSLSPVKRIVVDILRRDTSGRAGDV